MHNVLLTCASSTECNNLPWPMAVPDFGHCCRQGREDPAVGTASCFQQPCSKYTVEEPGWNFSLWWAKPVIMLKADREPCFNFPWELSIMKL